MVTEEALCQRGWREAIAHPTRPGEACSRLVCGFKCIRGAETECGP